jgi:acyl-CoA dehydrogenase
VDFSLNEKQEGFRKSVRDFCESRIAPLAAEIDEKGEIPRTTIQEMGSFGLFGTTISKEMGGSASGFISAAVAAEEIARAEMSMATAVYFLVEAGWGFLMDRYGTKRAREELLPDVVKGKSFLGIASTEATGGSDIASASTSLEKKDNVFVMNGSKSYISGVREAAQYGGGFVTVTRTDAKAGHKGLSLCYLPVKGADGVTVSTSRQMGREGISNGFIMIKNVEIPPYYLIGDWNRGFYYAREGFNCARTLVSAACIGAAGRALEIGLERIRNRRLFGSSLSKFQGIQFQMAEAYTRLESARLLVLKAAWMLDRMYSGISVNQEELNKIVAAAKLTAPTAAFDIIKDVMMWHGAYGYTREAGLERGLRGVTSYVVGAEGAQNIMRLIIAKGLLGKSG